MSTTLSMWAGIMFTFGRFPPPFPGCHPRAGVMMRAETFTLRLPRVSFITFVRAAGLEAVNQHYLAVGGFPREDAPDGEAAHLQAGLLVRASVRATTTPPCVLGERGRTLASAACAFLSDARACGHTAYMSAGLGVVGALAGVGLLAQHPPGVSPLCWA